MNGAGKLLSIDRVKEEIMEQMNDGKEEDNKSVNQREMGNWNYSIANEDAATFSIEY